MDVARIPTTKMRQEETKQKLSHSKKCDEYVKSEKKKEEKRRGRTRLIDFSSKQNLLFNMLHK